MKIDGSLVKRSFVQHFNLHGPVEMDKYLITKEALNIINDDKHRLPIHCLLKSNCSMTFDVSQTMSRWLLFCVYPGKHIAPNYRQEYKNPIFPVSRV